MEGKVTLAVACRLLRYVTEVRALLAGLAQLEGRLQ